MTEPYDLSDLWDEIERFNDTHFPDWRDQDIRLISNALAGEAGEVCDDTKHYYGGGTNPKLVDNISESEIAEEVFDVFVYGVLLIGAMGFTKADFVSIGKKKLGTLYERMKGKEGRL